MKKILSAAMIVGMGLGALPVVAHHATSTFYHNDRNFEMSGSVVEVIWANPHGVIVLEDDDGEKWVGEMAAVISLRNQGLTPDLLPVGQKIGVIAHPSRDGSHRIHINAISIDGEFVYGSPDE